MKFFIYKFTVKFLQKLNNLKNPVTIKIKDIINKALTDNPQQLKKTKLKWDENQIVYHHIIGVVGDGIGEELPLLSTRLYHEVLLLEKILGELSVDRSLEIGCGYGRLTPWIAKHSKDHYAIEPTKKLYKWAKLLYPKVKIECTSCDELLFPDNYFNLIITWTVLQHIPPGRFKKSIQEIKRVLKDDGILIITEDTNKNSSSANTWGHSIQEYNELFSPKKLVEHFERKVENFTRFHAVKSYYMGEVMKFI